MISCTSRWPGVWEGVGVCLVGGRRKRVSLEGVWKESRKSREMIQEESGRSRERVGKRRKGVGE